MAEYHFRSQKDPDWCARTGDARGRRLPRNLAPWRLIDGVVMPISADPRERERVEGIIRTEGFYLFRSPPLESGC